MALALLADYWKFQPLQVQEGGQLPSSALNSAVHHPPDCKIGTRLNPQEAFSHHEAMSASCSLATPSAKAMRPGRRQNLLLQRTIRDPNGPRRSLSAK